MLNSVDSYLLIIEKIIGMLAAIVYLFFALIVVKQVQTMSKNVKDMFNPLLITFAYAHLVATLVLILLAIVVL
jgi:hypothetical protein